METVCLFFTLLEILDEKIFDSRGLSIKKTLNFHVFVIRGVIIVRGNRTS